ncbi:hypothetical protein GE061_002211 [Apolygus lucorum]|uniref:Uncharacterized protein n=1 Tax=Apolygus lucorum TaxID=248454 RepID=A0A8S9X729_APOLU|nr:hypothetical protein GE061_002211 [Apolygus lucorum]
MEEDISSFLIKPSTNSTLKPEFKRQIALTYLISHKKLFKSSSFPAGGTTVKGQRSQQVLSDIRFDGKDHLLGPIEKRRSAKEECTGRLFAACGK